MKIKKLRCITTHPAHQPAFLKFSRTKALVCFWLAVGVITPGVFSTAYASLIVNGGFENPVEPEGGWSVVPTGWATPYGGAIIHPPGTLGPLFPSPQTGLQYEILFSGGMMSQAFHATAGDYQLTWYDNTLTDRYTRYNVYVMEGSPPTVSSAPIPPIVATAAFEHFHGHATDWNARSLSTTLATGDYFLLFSNGNSSSGISRGDKPFGNGLVFPDDTYFALDNITFSQVPDFAITCPPAQSVQCLADVPAPATDLASFLAQGGTMTGGVGCGSPTLTLVTEETGGTCNKTITRTYRITTSNLANACFNSADCTQTITVQDTTPPAIRPAGPNATIECPTTPNFTAPTAIDNCDPAPLIVEVSDVTTPGACAGASTRTKTWHAVDACGLVSATVSQTITVQDTTPPVATTATGSLDRTVECGDATGMAEAMALAPAFTDNCAGTVSLTLPSTETLTDLTCPNVYMLVRRWHAVDSCGILSLEFVQTITVRDTMRPVATTATGSLDRTVECGDAPGMAEAMALAPAFTDNCSGTVSRPCHRPRP